MSELKDLLESAVGAGVLSPATESMLTGHLGNVVIAGAAGTAMENIESTDVTLVTILIDASSSISFGGLEQAVREGQRELLAAFAGSREKDKILVALWTFNDDVRVVHSYVPVGDATQLDEQSYRASGYTRLYDAWCDALASNVAYAQALRDGGTPVRSVVVVITDGEDTGSSRKPKHCRALSEDLLRSEQFVLAFVGVGSESSFKKIAKGMGVPEGCIEVQRQATPAALRQVFQMVSRSAIRASQGKIQPGVQAGFFRP
jgi:hypothetical protein